MAANFEVALRDLLVTDGRSDQLAQRLQQRLGKSQLDIEEKTALVRFLMSGGHLQIAMDHFIRWFESGEGFPLFEFLYLLHMSGFRPDKDFIDYVFKARSELSTDALPYFPRWNEYDDRFKQLQNKHVENLHNQFSDRKKSMLDRLEYMRLNRLLDEEEKLLNDLVQMYPDDESLRNAKESFKERWAREVILQKSFESFDSGMQVNEPLFTREEIQFARVLVSECQELATRKGELAYNLALLLCFMELYEPALEVLKRARSSVAVDWLYTEVLLQARHYVECLDALSALETRYADDPETNFGVTYYRALALEGLGQLGTASELMRSIVNIRPDYRSAHSMLLKWAGGT